MPRVTATTSPRDIGVLLTKVLVALGCCCVFLAWCRRPFDIIHAVALFVLSLTDVSTRQLVILAAYHGFAVSIICNRLRTVPIDWDFLLLHVMMALDAGYVGYQVLFGSSLFAPTTSDVLQESAGRLVLILASAALGDFVGGIGYGALLLVVIASSVIAVVPSSRRRASAPGRFEGEVVGKIPFGVVVAFLLPLMIDCLLLFGLFCMVDWLTTHYKNGRNPEGAFSDEEYNNTPFVAEVYGIHPGQRNSWMDPVIPNLRVLARAIHSVTPRGTTLQLDEAPWTIMIDDDSRSILEDRLSRGHMLCRIIREGNTGRKYHLSFKDFANDKDVPHYVAISHAWWPPVATRLVPEFKYWDVFWKQDDDMWQTLASVTKGSWFWIDVLCLPQRRQDVDRCADPSNSGEPPFQDWNLRQEECMGRLLVNMQEVYSDSRVERTLVLIKGSKCPLATERALAKLVELHKMVGAGASVHHANILQQCPEIMSPLCLMSDPWFLRLWTCLELCVSNNVSFVMSAKHVCGISCGAHVGKLMAVVQRLLEPRNAALLEYASRTLVGNGGPFFYILAELCSSWTRDFKQGLDSHAPFNLEGLVQRYLRETRQALPLQDMLWTIKAKVLTTGRRVECERDYCICAAILTGLTVGSSWGSDSIQAIVSDVRRQSLPELLHNNLITYVSTTPRGAYGIQHKSALPMYGASVHETGGVQMLKPIDSRSWLELIGKQALQTESGKPVVSFMIAVDIRCERLTAYDPTGGGEAPTGAQQTYNFFTAESRPTTSSPSSEQQEGADTSSTAVNTPGGGSGGGEGGSQGRDRSCGGTSGSQSSVDSSHRGESYVKEADSGSHRAGSSRQGARRVDLEGLPFERFAFSSMDAIPTELRYIHGFDDACVADCILCPGNDGAPLHARCLIRMATVRPLLGTGSSAMVFLVSPTAINGMNVANPESPNGIIWIVDELGDGRLVVVGSVLNVGLVMYNEVYTEAKSRDGVKRVYLS